MPALTEPAIPDLVARIVRSVAPEKVVLFGSRAGGRGGPDSDVDFLVVGGSYPTGRSRREALSRIRRALWDVPVPVDVILVTRAEVEQWKDAVNHVIARSLREGQVVYDRTRGSVPAA